MFMMCSIYKQWHTCQVILRAFLATCLKTWTLSAIGGEFRVSEVCQHPLIFKAPLKSMQNRHNSLVHLYIKPEKHPWDLDIALSSTAALGGICPGLACSASLPVPVRRCFSARALGTAGRRRWLYPVCMSDRCARQQRSGVVLHSPAASRRGRHDHCRAHGLIHPDDPSRPEALRQRRRLLRRLHGEGQNPSAKSCALHPSLHLFTFHSLNTCAKSRDLHPVTTSAL